MKYAVLALAVLLSPCVQTTSDADFEKMQAWATTVKPDDPVPDECKTKPPARQRLQEKAYDAAESARAYRSLSGQYDTLRASYIRCQIWAQGQR